MGTKEILILFTDWKFIIYFFQKLLIGSETEPASVLLSGRYCLLVQKSLFNKMSVVKSVPIEVEAAAIKIFSKI